MEAKDKEMLVLAHKAKDDPEPSWKSAKWAYVFVLGGLAFFVWDILDRTRPGATAGFFMGAGLMAVLIQVPLSRLLWRCCRLLRRADEAGAFAQDAD